MPNMEGIKWYGQEWRTMNLTDLHAWALILAQVRLLLVCGISRQEDQYFIPPCPWKCSVPYWRCSDLTIVRQELHAVSLANQQQSRMSGTSGWNGCLLCTTLDAVDKGLVPFRGKNCVLLITASTYTCYWF